MPKQTFIPGIEGRERKKRRKHRITRVLPGKNKRRKMYWFCLIVQHWSVLQTTLATIPDLDQQINLSITIAQTDLVLKDWMEKKDVKGPYRRANTGLL